jgi:hypothetical protein
MSINLYNRFDTTAFIVIVVLASVVTVATWAKMWWKTRKLFPSKKRLLTYIPGLVLAVTGLVIFSAFQNGSNYWILHSIWHMLISFAILFFMPDCEGQPLFSKNLLNLLTQKCNVKLLKNIFARKTSISNTDTTSSTLNILSDQISTNSPELQTTQAVSETVSNSVNAR